MSTRKMSIVFPIPFFQILSQTDPLFIACSRNVIVLLLSYPLFLRNGGWGGLQKTSKTLKFQLAIRAVCSNINLMTMFYAFRHLPLGRYIEKSL